MEGDVGRGGLGFGAGNKDQIKPGLQVRMGNKEHSGLGRKWGNSFEYFGGMSQIGTSHLEHRVDAATP